MRCCAEGAAIGLSWEVKLKAVVESLKESIGLARFVHFNFTCSYEIPGLNAIFGAWVVFS